MGEDKKSFQDELKIFAEISDLLEKSNILNKDKTIVKKVLDKEDFFFILKNFREIDWNKNEFIISFDNIDFIFSLQK